MQFGVIQWAISLTILCVIFAIIIFFIIQLGKRDRNLELQTSTKH